MRLYLFAYIFSLITLNTFAQSDNPVIPKSGNQIKAFIPRGWKILSQSKGDLNKDNLPDAAIVIENTNPKNIIANEEGRMGGDTLNINPRMLIVLFKNSNNNYSLAAKNTAFIPTQNDTVSTCLADPFQDSEGIFIEKGLLKINYRYFYSCGGWEITDNDYIFRFQNQKFELIGYNSYSMHRASGAENASSINFSTLKKDNTTGGNTFFEEKNKPKTSVKKIKPVKLLSLEPLTQDIVDDYLSKIYK